MKEHRDNEEFVRLLAANQQDILRYVRSIIPCDADAQDVVQETAVALWKKFEQYDSSQPFRRWAIGFARTSVYNYRKRCVREKQNTVMLSDDVIELLSVQRAEHGDTFEPQRGALRFCLAKVDVAVRKLLVLRYGDRRSVANMADETGQNVQTLYKRLARARRGLRECIEQRLAEEEDQ